MESHLLISTQSNHDMPWQILEDAGPEWVVAVLYRPAAQNIATRDTLNNLLKANDPGGAVPVSGGLDTLAHENVKC